MKMKLIGLLVLPLLAACASKHAGLIGFQKDEVLATSEDRDQPTWADETKPFKVSDGKIISVGIVQIRGDERPEAATRISENNARANISKAIENRMEFVFQNAEENASYESTAAKYIGSEVSSLTAHSMKKEGVWWKRFAQSQEDGSRRIFYKIYSLVSMPESDFKAAVFEALNKGANQHKLSQSFQQQVDKQWDRFVEGKTDSKIAESKEEPKN